jgi:hypothetical protein
MIASQTADGCAAGHAFAIGVMIDRPFSPNASVMPSVTRIVRSSGLSVRTNELDRKQLEAVGNQVGGYGESERYSTRNEPCPWHRWRFHNTSFRELTKGRATRPCRGSSISAYRHGTCQVVSDLMPD